MQYPTNVKCPVNTFLAPGTKMGAVGILSNQSFDSLKDAVCEPTLKGISEMGFTHMTAIQAKTIPHLLEGRDLVSIWSYQNEIHHEDSYLF